MKTQVGWMRRGQTSSIALRAHFKARFAYFQTQQDAKCARHDLVDGRRASNFPQHAGGWKHALIALGVILLVLFGVVRGLQAQQDCFPEIVSPRKTAIYEGKEEYRTRTGHPRHVTKTWKTTYRNRTFRVTQIPRCEHIEATIAYHRRGETKEQAKRRLNGIAVCTGSFHHPRSMAVADFLQHDGTIVAHARTGRWFLTLLADGKVDISDDYMLVKKKSGVSAVALGQRLVPLYKDGFSASFMNRVTDRMALGLGSHYIYIVQGRSDIWRLSEFMRKKLPIESAINADGGHVVRGKAPVHIVFRWRKQAKHST